MLSDGFGPFRWLDRVRSCAGEADERGERGFRALAAGHMPVTIIITIIIIIVVVIIIV